jgi:hypothetical protein
MGSIFPALMFDQVRENIGKLDSRTMAELKSYKKPPKVIRKSGIYQDIFWTSRFGFKMCFDSIGAPSEHTKAMASHMQGKKRLYYYSS